MSEFIATYRALCREMAESDLVDVGRWQSQNVTTKTYELMDTRLVLWMPATIVEAQTWSQCNLPWAEDHFLERVSGQALNPAPSEQWWPYKVNGNAEHKEGTIFSHTYPERIWPKHADPKGHKSQGSRARVHMGHVNDGLRYKLGDLGDIVELMKRERYTRQAYLPLWFPEDTGVVHGGRVPCTLGYQFMVREERMHIWYYMRSCDIVRHFRDDVYMAVRLAQWMGQQIGVTEMGQLHMNIASLHAFEPDLARLEDMANGGRLS